MVPDTDPFSDSVTSNVSVPGCVVGFLWISGVSAKVESAKVVLSLPKYHQKLGLQAAQGNLPLS